jgi:hypothetical protein
MKVDHLTIKTVWIKGKDNVKSDALSCHPCAKADSEDELDEDFHVVQGHLLELNVLHAQDRHIVDERLCELRYLCNEDADYKMITKNVVKGFLKDAINIQDTLMAYYKAQDDSIWTPMEFCVIKTFLLSQWVSGCTKDDCHGMSISMGAVHEERHHQFC